MKFTTNAISRLATILYDYEEGTYAYGERHVRHQKYDIRQKAILKEREKERKRVFKTMRSNEGYKFDKKDLSRAFAEAESQSGNTDFVTSITALIKEWELPDGLGTMLLKIFCYYRSIRKAIDWDQFINITGLFLLGVCDEDLSFIKTVSESLFGKDVNLGVLESSDVAISQSGFCFGEAMDLLKGAKLLKENELSRRIIQVITTTFACGLVKGKSELKFSEFNLKWVLNQFTKDSGTIFDFFESVIDIFQFLVEKGYTCFQERSFAPLFMSEIGAADYDKDLAEVFGYWPAIQAGNFKDTPFISVPHYANALDNLYIATTALVEQSTDDFSKRYHTKTLERINTIQAKFKSQERSGGLRESPFAFCVFGKSSVGKSPIMSILTDYCLKASALIKDAGRDDFKIDPRMICSQNAKDKFDSDYKSYTLAVLFDDLANERVEVADGSPLDAVIRYVNNIKSTALKADVHEKGVIQKEPLLIGASTNIKNLQADLYSVEPLSILRRFNVHVEPFVAPEYQKKDGIFLDGGKLADANQRVADCWRFRAYHFEYGDKTYKQTATSETLNYQSVPFRFTGFDGAEYISDDLDMEQLQWLLYQLLEDHWKAQSSVVRSNNLLCAEKLCEHKVHTAICSICSPHHAKPTSRSACSNCGTLEFMEDVNYAFDFPQGEFCIDNEEISDRNGVDLPDLDICHEAISHSGFNTHLKNLGKIYMKGCAIIAFYSFYYYATKKILTYIYQRRFFWRTRQAATNAYWHYQYYQQAMAFYAKNYIQNVNCAIDEINYLRYVSWRVTDFIPDSWVSDPRFAWMYMFNYDHDYYTQLVVSILTFWLFLTWIHPTYVWRFFFAVLGYAYIALLLRKKFLMQQLRERRGVLRPILMHSAKVITGVSIQLMLTFGGVVVSYKLIKTLFNMIKFIGNISHGGDVQIEMEKENVWLEAKPRQLPDYTPYTSNMNHQHVGDLVRKNTITCVYDSQTWSSGFFPRSQILLVPAHEILGKDHLTLKLIKDPAHELSAGNVTLDITPARVYYFAGKDVAAIYHSRYQDKQNLTGLFPESIPTDNIATDWITRDCDGNVQNGVASRHGVVEKVRTDKTEFDNAIMVNYRDPTAGGDCMKVHISRTTRKAHIVGFHLAGRGRTGYLSSLTQWDLEQCYAHFDRNPITRLTASEGKFKTELYGKKFAPITPKNKKSTINYLEKAEIEYFGDLPDFVTRPKSAVEVSPISDLVASHCSFENKWGKPANCRDDDTKIPNQEPYNKYYQGAGNATQEFPLELLNIAVEDYIDDCLSADNMTKELFELRPLTEIETVSGQDGIKFVDGMKLSTSKGFPLSGSKEDVIVRLDPAVWTSHADPKTLINEIIDEWRYAENEYLQGRRVYPIFKACTKDEPTKMSKTKVRIFQSAPLVLQCLIRKYYLPIAACMSRHPILTECAVGINSQGPQWNQLINYLSKYGEDRMVAGDFKAYDQHMSSTMTSCAFSIMIEFAKRCRLYDENDIAIMSNMVADIVHPVMCVNGDLVRLLGSNPSGQNLTVYVNSIVNSIYQRCVFYSIYPPGSLPSIKFRDYVALMTYGDDNIMSVSSDAPEYNHTRMQEVYAYQGIEYTMADKDAESVPYIHLRDTDFLKRSSEYHPQYTDPKQGSSGMWLCKLSEDAIFKSLHCTMKSSELPSDDIARQCLDGALRELWFHGRDHYEKRAAQLRAVVAEQQWEHLMPVSFYESFEEKEAQWLDRYDLIRTQPESHSGMIFSQAGRIQNFGANTCGFNTLPLSNFLESVLSSMAVKYFFTLFAFSIFYFFLFNTFRNRLFRSEWLLKWLLCGFYIFAGGGVVIMVCPAAFVYYYFSIIRIYVCTIIYRVGFELFAGEEERHLLFHNQLVNAWLHHVVHGWGAPLHPGLPDIAPELCETEHGLEFD